jgi:hypothetical protein
MKPIYKTCHFIQHRIPVFNLAFIFLFIIHVQTGAAQSRNAIGFRYGLNKPYSDAYKFGTGGALQANIAFSKKWGFDASFNYDRINGDQSTFFSPVEQELITLSEAKSLDLFHIDLAARYYIIPDVFAKLGPILYFAGGNDDLGGLGIGGTAAIGYQLMLDKRNKLEFVFSTDLINVQRSIGTGITPIAGLKVAYAFNFSRR